MADHTETPKLNGSSDPSGSQTTSIGRPHSDLIALYSENGSIARAMMDWRHRVITLYVLTLGGVGSTVLWLQKNNALPNVPLTFFTAAIIVCVLGLMDHTNARLLGACYRVGDSIERILFEPDGTIYAALHTRRQSKRTITYTRILYVLNFGTAAIFLGVALYFWWRPLA